MKKKKEKKKTKTESKRETRPTDLSMPHLNLPIDTLPIEPKVINELKIPIETDRAPKSALSRPVLDASLERTYPLPQQSLLIHPLLLQHVSQILHAVITLSLDRRDLEGVRVVDGREHSFEEGEDRGGGFEVCQSSNDA